MTSSKPKRKPGIVAIGCLVSVIGGAIMLAVAFKNPEWADHADRADAAYSANDIPTMDKEVQELLKYSADGSAPPNIPPPLFAYIFPMQDLDEDITYTGRMRQLANNYDYAKRHEDAEKIYRLVLELDKKHFGPESDSVLFSDYTPLISSLKSQNKTAEARKLKEERISILEKLVVKQPHRGLDTQILREKQEILEESGDVSKAEELIKQRIAAAEKSEDMSQTAVERLKKFNDDNKGQVHTSFNFVRELEDQAKFYDRNKMYEKEAAVIRRAQDLRIKIHGSPDEIGDGWRELSRCYESQGKFHDAVDAITHEIDLYQSNGRRQDSLEWTRKKRDELIEKAKSASPAKS